MLFLIELKKLVTHYSFDLRPVIAAIYWSNQQVVVTLDGFARQLARRAIK